MIVAYVSGHGFGHATRVGEVLRTLRELWPGAPLAVATSGPEALFRRAIPDRLVFRPIECDVGLVQRDALVIDEAATAERCRDFESSWDARVVAETDWLRSIGARLVMADVPPLAFAAAAAVGVPSAGLANFSWDWIYRHLAARQPRLAESADRAAEAYSQAALLLELPFAGDLGAFRRRERVGLVARRPRVDKTTARQRLGLDDRPAVLLSFGGLGLPGLTAAKLEGQEEYRFLFPDELPGERLEQLGLGYVDVVAAVDVVVTKPGYGIVSDAIGAGTRLIYTERGDFPEYPILAREMAEYLPCVHVSNQDLLAGHLRDPLRDVLARSFPPPPRRDGAQNAARRLLEMSSAAGMSPGSRAVTA